MKPVSLAIAALLGIGGAAHVAAAQSEPAATNEPAASDTPAPAPAPPPAPTDPSATPPAATDPAEKPAAAPEPMTPAAASEPTKPAEAPGDSPGPETREPAAPEAAPAGRNARAAQEQTLSESATDSTTNSWKTDPNQKTSLPWHGSVLMFDQSVTTQTIGVGADYQSADPVYEWWFAFKPRYAFYESKLESFSVSLWANLYLELTNSDTTTTEHEPVIGPTWLTATYGRTLLERDGWKTSLTIGPRLSIPTDKASRNTGQILGLGASTGLSQRIPLNGEAASSFNTVRFGVTATYNHPISRYDTMSGPNQPGQSLGTPIEDLGNGRTTGVQGTSGGTTSQDNTQLNGGFITKHALTVAFSGDLQVTPKLGFGISYSLINRWSYQPNYAVPVCIATGCINSPVTVDSPTFYRASNWLTVSADYDLFDEMTLSLGYYNQALQLGPDGQRRDVLWSPEARFFFTITGNLDAIYESLSSKPSPPTNAATAHR